MPLAVAYHTGGSLGFGAGATADAAGHVYDTVVVLVRVDVKPEPCGAEAAVLVGPKGLDGVGIASGVGRVKVDPGGEGEAVSKVVAAFVKPGGTVEVAARTHDAGHRGGRDAVGRRVLLRAVLEGQGAFLEVIDHFIGWGGAKGRHPDPAIGAPGQRGRSRRVAPISPDEV